MSEVLDEHGVHVELTNAGAFCLATVFLLGGAVMLWSQIWVGWMALAFAVVYYALAAFAPERP